MTTDLISPNLKATLPRLKLSRILDTLPDRLVLSDEVTRRDSLAVTLRVQKRTSNQRCIWRPGILEEETARLKGLKLEIEHIFPESPSSTWSGDGRREWASFTEEERARHRALPGTFGNLALLEQPLNAGAGNKPFSKKKTYYPHSTIGSTKALADDRVWKVWNVRAIERRTKALTEKFLQVWHRPGGGSEPPGPVVPILDALKKPGFYPGWRTEFAYVKFRDETWEVHDVKTLYNCVFKRLWSTHRSAVRAYNTSLKEPTIYETEAWESQWDALGDSQYLFMGFVPQYMLGHVQGVLDELGLADEVFVKYSSDEDDGS